MIPISDKLDEYLNREWSKVIALVEFVVEYIQDVQSSKDEWEAGLQLLCPDLATTTFTVNCVAGATSCTVVTTDEFTAANAANEGYLVFTDGAAYEVVKYDDIDSTHFKGMTRAQYGTAAQGWSPGDFVIQLHISSGIASDYDLQLQPKNWWVHQNVGVSGGGSPPTQRIGHAMIYRPTDGCFYMFGGYDSTGTHKQDFWRFDPASQLWTDLSGATGGTPPAGRAYHAMVYNPDVGTGEIWIAGGETNPGGLLTMQDVHKYSFNANSWSTNAAWNMPDVRRAMQYCYDKQNDQMLIAGGVKNYAPFFTQHQQLWAFDGSTWTTLTSIGYVVSRGSGCWMDSEKLFFTVGVTAGADFRAQIYNPDTDTWETTEITNPPTDKLYYPSVCYDPLNKNVLFFGGEKNSGLAKYELFKYTYQSNAWTQLCDYSFDSNNDYYSRHTFEWDTANNFAMAWGGWDTSAPQWHAYDDPIYYRYYHECAIYQTQTIDLGQVPTENGVWEINDITDTINNTSSISYSFEWSDDGSAWVPVAGDIVDGDEITDLHRYYRVTCDFDNDNEDSPRVISISPTFTVKDKYMMSPRSFNDYPNIVKSIKSITSKIDVLKSTASIGKTTVTLMNSAREGQALITDNFVRNNDIFIYLGIDEDDFEEKDFELVLKGRINDWGETNVNTIEITTNDFFGDLKYEIPEYDTVGGDITALDYTNGGIPNPVDIILDILQNQIAGPDGSGIPDRDIDIPSFELVKDDASLSGWKLQRTVSNPTDAYDMILEICRHIGAVMIPRENGKLTLVLFDADDDPVGVWNERLYEFKSVRFLGVGNSIRNWVETWYGGGGAGSQDWADFAGAEVATDATSITNWGKKVLRTKSKWLGTVATYNGDTRAAEIGARILALAKYGIPEVTLQTSMAAYPYQVADLIRVQTSIISSWLEYREWQRVYNPDRTFGFETGDRGRHSVPYKAYDCEECVDFKFWITKKVVDFRTGKIDWKIARARQAPLEIEITSQADFEQGSTSENIDFDTSPGDIQLAIETGVLYYADGYWENVYDMGQQPEREGTFNYTDDGPWAAPEGITYELWASELGLFAGEETKLEGSGIGGLWVTGDPITVKTRYYKVRANLTANGAKDSTPVLSDITISFDL